MRGTQCQSPQLVVFAARMTRWQRLWIHRHQQPRRAGGRAIDAKLIVSQPNHLSRLRASGRSREGRAPCRNTHDAPFRDFAAIIEVSTHRIGHLGRLQLEFGGTAARSKAVHRDGHLLPKPSITAIVHQTAQTLPIGAGNIETNLLECFANCSLFVVAVIRRVLSTAR